MRHVACVLARSRFGRGRCSRAVVPSYFCASSPCVPGLLRSAVQRACVSGKETACELSCPHALASRSRRLPASCDPNGKARRGARFCARVAWSAVAPRVLGGHVRRAPASSARRCPSVSLYPPQGRSCACVLREEMAPAFLHPCAPASRGDSPPSPAARPRSASIAGRCVAGLLLVVRCDKHKLTGARSQVGGGADADCGGADAD